ncbi:hypothetical protein BLNAU_22631 [Blattamonas nauphoetae]|uniref:Uncharacterized protein n=1 Tax=Blattamonas nauphoetae TaxID=2049346 RepID=A0ABQ9WSG1_9EUKA|nr:hypothetical protein BLNAU_22631 [Blattamonas nauphoetae]
MLVDEMSVRPDIDAGQAKQTNFIETFLSHICGECIPFRAIMLNGLLVLVTESDWALSTILGVEYIKPLEEYCSKTQPCDVPITLPKLLIVIGKSSEDELDRICESSIPSFFLEWMVSTSNSDLITAIGNCVLLWTSTLRSSSTFLAHHKTHFLAFINHFESHEFSIPHLTILTLLCFSPHLEVSKKALQPLFTPCISDSETRSFLRTFKVPSGSNNSSSELVPFAGRLCSTLAEHVSQMKSLFAESSPSDGTISASSATLPEESPLLTGNTILEMLCDRLTLLDMLLIGSENFFHNILIKSDFVPLIKSTIITCLDLLDQLKSESICQPKGQHDRLIEILDRSWDCSAYSLSTSLKSLHPIVESAFSDVPQLCSLLERTCCFSSPTHFCHLRMIINVSASLRHFVPRMLEEDLVQRVINTTKPMTVSTKHGPFHLRLIWVVLNVIGNPKYITQNKKEQKRIRKLQFERVLKPAKQYLRFVLQREEFIPKGDSSDRDLPTQVTYLLIQVLLLERDLFEDGENVETRREEWEVGHHLVYPPLESTMLVDEMSVHPDIDAGQAKQTNLIETFLSHICGECIPFRAIMLNGLLVLVTESDWALSTILGVEYIKPLEEYCSKTQPCDVPV